MGHGWLIVCLACLAFAESAQPQESEEGFYDFTVDERVYVLFGQMNAPGFDAEWRNEGMHHLRNEAREYLREHLDSSPCANAGRLCRKPSLGN